MGFALVSFPAAYVTWRDPFVYFHSLIDNPTCTSRVVGLDQLAPDLKAPTRTPALAYIVPDRCHDGSDEPCAPGAPSGLAAADAFLSKTVPQIESSAAYKAGGLIAITFDQAPAVSRWPIARYSANRLVAMKKAPIIQ